MSKEFKDDIDVSMFLRDFLTFLINKISKTIQKLCFQE